MRNAVHKIQGSIGVMKSSWQSVSAGLAFWVLLVLTLLIYWPGLSGPFLFDDIPHLSALGARGGVVDWDSFVTYITSGFAGPTGRPVALLSFLLDANNWPASAEPFKFTNLCIHLLNGCVLFWVTLQVLRYHYRGGPLDSTAMIAAYLTVAVWLLHPYLVSTTLYVVQRMAMLSTLFVFAGVAIWLKARSRVAEKPKAAYFWMTFALAGPGILAVLSKENGALLPVLVLVIEVTVIRASGAHRLAPSWKLVFLILPTLLITAYLLYYPTKYGWFDQYSTRNFSSLERLLTEGRIILDYLRHWFVPELYTSGLYHDHIKVSRGLFDPPKTIMALIAIGTVLYVSVKKRTQWPIASMAVLFFFASQMIESTTIALELKFEHRMYMGSGFLFLPVFYKVLCVKKSRVILLPMLAFPAILAAMLWQNTIVWGNYESMAKLWASEAKESPRAQVELAKAYYENGEPKKAIFHLNAASQRLPDSFYLRVNQLAVQCRFSAVQKSTKDDVLELAQRIEYSPGWHNTLTNFSEWVVQGRCPEVDARYLAKLSDFLIKNDKSPSPNSIAFSQLAYVRGVAYLELSKKEQGIASFEESLKARENPGRLMAMAARLATKGYLEHALEYSKRAKYVLEHERLAPRARAEAPSLSDLENFITTIQEEMNKR